MVELNDILEKTTCDLIPIGGEEGLYTLHSTVRIAVGEKGGVLRKRG